jgi:uncharacterized protein YndB with AHSA1/START domain
MTTFRTSRHIPASPDEVFAAISDPQRLARWWGPAGFTNTFNVCEFEAGGRWEFVMHGPDGRSYPNESVFADVEAPGKVVVEHRSAPRFRLTITMTPSDGGTTVAWAQAFESDDVAKSVEEIVVPANEQNLDRLAAEALRQSSGA